MEIKNKWRHVRDNFVRSIAGGKSGSAASKKKKYVYADCLAFLLSANDKRSTSGNISFENTEHDVGLFADSIDNEDDDGNLTEIPPVPIREAGNKSVATVAKKTSSRSSKIPNMSPFQSELLQKLNGSSNAEVDDPDKSFLLSLLPDYKKLDDDKRLEFRIQILQCLKGTIKRKLNSNLTPPYASQQWFSGVSSGSVYSNPGQVFNLQNIISSPAYPASSE